MRYRITLLGASLALETFSELGLGDFDCNDAIEARVARLAGLELGRFAIGERAGLQALLDTGLLVGVALHVGLRDSESQRTSRGRYCDGGGR